MHIYLYFLLVAGTALWVTPFFRGHSKGQTLVKIDKRARWGVFLQCLAYSLLWQGHFWEKSPSSWRVVASCCFFAAGCVISWTAARALGRQFRFEAAVDSAHTLVRSGPYCYVRHPIYTSMLCVLLASGLVLSPVSLLLGAFAVFIAGAVIRVRIEDSLLESQFGAEFMDYRQRVPGMLPFLK